MVGTHADARVLREKRFKLVKEAQALLDTPQITAEVRTKFDAMMAEADVLKSDIERVERMSAAELETRGSAAPPNAKPDQNADVAAHVATFRNAERRHGAKAIDTVSAEVRATIESLNAEYWRAASAYLIGGNHGMSQEARAIMSGARPELRSLGVGPEYRDMGTGGGNALSGTGGGYFVPVGFINEVENALKYYGDMLNVATIMTTATGQPLPYPTDNATTVAGERIGENQQVSEADVALGSITFNAYKYSTKMIKVSIELLQDSAFDLETFFKDKMATRLGRILNTDFTVGTGSANSQPMGLLTATVNGGLYVTATGATGNDGGAETGGTTLGSDDFINLEHAIDPLYRRGSIYVFHDTTLRTIRKVKDKYGRPLWQPGLAVNAPDTINGYEYSINNDMPVIALNAKTIVFGQVKKYMIRRVKELGILRLNERFADYGQVAFIGFARYDGNLLDAGTHPCAYLQQAAA